MPYNLTDTLLALVLLSLLLGLIAGELAMLIRVGSGSLPALKKVWTWSASGKPLTCPTCLGAWCALLTFVAGTLFAIAVGEEPTTRVLLLTLVAVPAASAIAAVVQRWVLVEELVLPGEEPDEEPSAQLELPLPTTISEGERHIQAVLRAGCDCKTCRALRAERAGKKEPRSP